jgi:ATP-dependent Zn protease
LSSNNNNNDYIDDPISEPNIDMDNTTTAALSDSKTGTDNNNKKDNKTKSQKMLQSENFLWILISGIIFMILLIAFGCSFYYIHEKRRNEQEKYLAV